MALAIPPGSDLSKIPLAANPNGNPPNFVDPPNLISDVQRVGIILAGFTLILLTIRLHIYLKMNRGLLLDDGAIWYSRSSSYILTSSVFLLIAYPLAILYTALASTLGRMTKHSWDTPLSAIDADYLKKLLITSIIYGPMFFFAKSAILLLYHRAFKPKVWMRWSVYVMIFIMFFAYWMTVPMNFMWCMPHHGHDWSLEILQTCSKLQVPGLIHGGMNLAADVIIVLLPLPVIAKLHIPLHRKIAISAIFATGLLALVCSALAVYYRVMIARNSDPVWANAQAFIVIQAEIYAAICVACMPSLAKLWRNSLKGTKVYTWLQSLLESANRATRDIHLASRVPRASAESTSALRIVSNRPNKEGQSAEAAEVSDNGACHAGDGVYKMTAFHITSEVVV